MSRLDRLHDGDKAPETIPSSFAASDCAQCCCKSHFGAPLTGAIRLRPDANMKTPPNNGLKQTRITSLRIVPDAP